MKFSALPLLCTSACLLALPAFAEESFTPSLSADVVMELQTEQMLNSDDSALEHNTTFGRTEIAPTLALSENWTISGNLVFEPIFDPDPGRDNFFRHEGAFVEELYMQYADEDWSVFAGKFNPAFGRAWDWGRGIWSEDFAEDYEITEKIGFGGSYGWEFEEMGDMAVILTGSTFFADTSALSRSYITNRGNLDEADGGASNTNDFSSFVTSVDVENAFGVGSLSLSAAYRHLAAADKDPAADDENGIALTAGYLFETSPRLKHDLLVEYAGLWNVDGAAEDRHYLSSSLVTRIDENWIATLGGTLRRIDPDGAPSTDDWLAQVTGGYDFDNGLTLEAGWRGSEESDINNHIFGGLLRYQFAI